MVATRLSSHSLPSCFRSRSRRRVSSDEKNSKTNLPLLTLRVRLALQPRCNWQALLLFLIQEFLELIDASAKALDYEGAED